MTPTPEVAAGPFTWLQPRFQPGRGHLDRIREDVTANTCFDKAAKVRKKVDAFFTGLADRAEEVEQRCRRDLQALADAWVTGYND